MFHQNKGDRSNYKGNLLGSSRHNRMNEQKYEVITKKFIVPQVKKVHPPFSEVKSST